MFRYIEQHYGVHTVAIQHNFDYTTVESIKVIEDVVSTLEVGVLLNNVGIHYDFPMRFDLVSFNGIEVPTSLKSWF